MGMFDTIMQHTRRNHSVGGKVSVGVPTDEVALVTPALIGKMLLYDVTSGRSTSVRRGLPLSETDIQNLQKAQIEEVHVIHGKYPTRLDYFRILRRANTKGQFVHDPALNARYGLGEHPTRIPIVFTMDDPSKSMKREMVNYDRKEKCLFCSSQDGRTARRAVLDEDEYTGEYTEVVCVPGWKDARNLPICSFRDKSTADGKARPCKFSGTLYFHILSEDTSNIGLGNFHKLETSSPESADRILSGLHDVSQQYGRISYVPCELELFFRQKKTPQGTQSMVPIITLIPASMEVMRRFRPQMEELRETMSFYSSFDEITEERNEGYFEGWDSEFRPEVRAEEIGEALGMEAASPVTEEFRYRLTHLDMLARRLPGDLYTKYKEKRGFIAPENIDVYLERTEARLSSVSEEDQKVNFENNAPPV